MKKNRVLIASASMLIFFSFLMFNITTLNLFSSNLVNTYETQQIILSEGKSLLAANQLSDIGLNATNEYGGEGTQENPYILSKASDFVLLSEAVAQGESFEGIYFKSVGSVGTIVLNNFNPIGSNSNPFKGHFDGDGVNFEMNINRPDVNYQAFFGYIEGSIIKNLSVTGSVTGAQYTGGVVGYQHSGEIKNVYNLADINGTSNVGGIVGYVRVGTVRESFNHGNVTASSSHAGGIAGYIHGNEGAILITNTYNRGEIIAHSNAGGIVGYVYNRLSTTNHSTVSYSYSSGLVSANTNAGGVLGYFASGANRRTHIYYDVSVLLNYDAPRNNIPSTSVGGMGLSKPDMIGDAFKVYGFSESVWTFRAIEGNYAYYPQIMVFAENENERIVNQSVLSVRTNPFLGDGTKASPFLIRTAQDMINLTGSISETFDAEGIYYLVEEGVTHFDLKETDFFPIGNEDIPFKGHFDGNYATFEVNLDGDDYQGLFGRLGVEGSIQRLAVGGQISGNRYIGGVVGYNNGVISEVYSTVLVEGSRYVGGITGYNAGEMEQLYQTGDVIASNAYVGGIAGYNTGVIREGYFAARLSGFNHIGGVVGYNAGTLSTLYYDQTTIEYYEIDDAFKPSRATGNHADSDTVKGIDKDFLKGLGIIGDASHQINFKLEDWVLEDTSGLYDFYPQLKGFNQHISNDIQEASRFSARTIRFAHGSGSRNNPYIIRDAFDMAAIAEITALEDLHQVFFKVDDGIDKIDLSQEGLNYLPIGRNASRPFRGGFDGNGVTFIVDIESSGDFQGLFGYLGSDAEVRNFSVTGSITGRDHVGLIGYATGATVEEVYNYADISGRNYTAGIIGRTEHTTIAHVYNFGNIEASLDFSGGIIGDGSNTRISGAYNFGVIEGRHYVGGIAGRMLSNSLVEYVYNRQNIYARGNYVGGLIGLLADGRLNEAYSASKVRGPSQSTIGGLIGRVTGVTHEANAYYDATIIDADDHPVDQKPFRAIGNKLDQNDVKAVNKTQLVGQNTLGLDSAIWSFENNQGVDAMYPQLKIFSEHEQAVIKEHSMLSTRTYVFAGEGTDSSPYIIVDEFDMKTLSTLVSSGESFKGVHFLVRHNAHYFDMTLNGLDYVPVGTIDQPFNGIFDGNGTDFILGLDHGNYAGLFGVVSAYGEIRHLSVSGHIAAVDFVGSIAGLNHGVIENVYATTTIEANHVVGGLIGLNKGILRNTYMIGHIQGANDVGGLVGINDDTVLNAYSASTVYGNHNLGGFIGSQTELGYAYYVYYNEALIQIQDHETLNKPLRGISNVSSDDFLTGTSLEVMTSGLLGDFDLGLTFGDLSVWDALVPFGFNLYYPQLNYFSNHPQAVIQSQSLASVTVDRFTEGDGSIETPYIIRTPADMKGISDLVQANDTLRGKYFKVADDVSYFDLTSELLDYQPIGNASFKFEGHFDGNFATFELAINGTSYYQGLFGFIGPEGTVQNTVTTGTVYGPRFAAGIAGRNEGFITQSYNLADITANDYYAGGITGYNSGIIELTYNTGTITVNNEHYAGGIAGRMTRNSVIRHSYNTGTISVGRWYAGGIVGYSDGLTHSTYNAALVTGARSGAISGRDTSLATTFDSYYDTRILTFTDTSGVVTSAIGNQADRDDVKGVNTSMLSGNDVYDLNINFDYFILRDNLGYEAYYPELEIFNKHENLQVREDSKQSVSTPLFEGEGTEEAPYLLIDRFDFFALSHLTRQGQYTEGVVYQVYEPSKAIDLTHRNFRPIGSEHPFKGIFNGNDSSVTLNINHTSTETGLFGTLAANSVVKDLTLLGKVTGDAFTGSLAGINEGTIHNVFSAVDVVGRDYTGGLIGSNNGIVIDSGHEGNVTGTLYVGGLTGFNDSFIQGSYHLGSVTASKQYVGGLVGLQTENGTLKDSFNDGDVFAKDRYAASLVGYNQGLIKRVFSRGLLQSEADYAAFITAVNTGEIRDVYASGRLFAQALSAGVVVTNNGVLENAYYDLTKIDAPVPTGFNIPSSAIYDTLDQGNIKGLTHEAMTGLYNIGFYDHQMQYLMDEWVSREGFDFTTFYPELNYFNTHENTRLNEASLEAITNRKLEGVGSSANPFIIYNVEDLLELKTFVENEHTFEGKHFIVHEDVRVLDLSNLIEPFTPIGTNQFYFGGTLDGQGVNIVLDIALPEQEYIGLFHTLKDSAVIKNLELSGAVVGESYVGALAGRNMGRVESVTSYVSVRSNDGNDIGGIVGYNEGTINGATNYGSVRMNGTYAGGITGQNTGTIHNSYNHASIKGNTVVGGIVGRNLGEMKYTYNMNMIEANSVVGGIAGENSRVITHSFNHGLIIANDSTAGGIVGNMHQSGSNAQVYIVYNTGNISTNGRLAGGIIGHLESGTVYDAYNGGDIEALSDIGAIIGQNINGSVTRSYYDLNALNQFVTSLNKPERAISNQENTSNVNGLFRGQMAGLSSIGSAPTQMNFRYGSHFHLEPSVDEWSFYPQINVFADSEVDSVREDSLESVRGLTFVVGKGTETDPYIINNESDMIALAETTNSGNTYEHVFFKVSDHIKVLDFLDTDIYQYIPVGNQDHAFEGAFDGNGTLFKVDINNNRHYQALFGHVGLNGHVKSVALTGSINANDYTAGIAGFNLGTIENVYNDATIHGRDYTAGLIGSHEGHLYDAYNNGEVIGRNYVGGIAGYADNIIDRTYNSGVIYGRNAVGALVGFLNKELISNSYYDTKVLLAYYDYGQLIRPTTAVSNSPNSDTVRGLDKTFMTGPNAIGTGAFNMNFTESEHFSVSYNITDNNHYPQLTAFARSNNETVLESSHTSTQTDFYEITLDYRGATEKNNTETIDVIDGYHYKMPVGFKFGFEFAGWFTTDDILNDIRLTNDEGVSLNPYQFKEDIDAFATWEVAYHEVRFVDGNNQTIHQETVLHGDLINPIDTVPSKNPSRTEVFAFEQWDFDFDMRILEDTVIYANYHSYDRYYRVQFLNGDGEFFDQIRIEYGDYLPTPSQEPRKTYHDNIAYRFLGWDYDDQTPIKENITVEPIFTEVDRYYDVRFFDGNGDVMLVRTVEYLDHALIPSERPTKEETASHTYQFMHWEDNYLSITEHTDVYPVFDENIRTFTVTFFDGNGEIFTTQEVPYNESPAIPTGFPRKASHGDTAYRFDGWQFDYAPIYEDQIVMPIFEAIDRYYLITFLDGNDEELETQWVEYLFDATAPAQSPTKPDTDQFTYTFNAWDQSLEMIEGSLTIRPVFDESLRPYRLTFIDGNGDIFDEQTVLYGQDGVMPEGIPRKAAHDDIGYKFTGFEDYTNITSDRTVEAQFEVVDRYYIVTFYAYDGVTILKTEQVEYGYGAQAPEVPHRTHSNQHYQWVFTGWSEAFDFVERNLSVTATYEAQLIEHTVTFIVDGEHYTQTVRHNEAATPPSTVIDKGNQMTYHFVEWDNPYTSITEDITITAVYEIEYHYYVVAFYDGDGSLIETQHVTPLENATAPSITPTKTSTNDILYVFRAWDQSLEAVESDMEIYSLFETVEKYYTVNFYNTSGALITSQTVHFGEDAIEPYRPTKPMDERYIYTFESWSSDFRNVQEDLELYPVFAQEERAFTVTFIDGDGVTIDEQLIRYGRTALAPNHAGKAPTDDYVYLHVGWDQSFSSVTEDLEITALFEAVDRYYTVSFYGEDNQLLDEQIIEYGHDAIDPIYHLPFEVLDEDTIYAITGWTKAFTNVQSNLEIHAIYETIDRYYTVTFYDAIGDVIESTIYEYASVATAPAEPSKATTNDFHYVFESWSESFAFINQDLEIYPVYEERPNYVTISFYDGNGNLFDEQVINYGHDANNPNGIPPKQATETTMFNFMGWDQSLTNIREDLVVHALYEETVRTFLVRFVDDNNQLLKEEYVLYNHSATPPTNIVEKPSTAVYDYIPRWDQDYTNIQEAMEISLYYEAVKRQYTYTFYDAFGDVLKRVSAEHGASIVPPSDPEKPMTEQFTFTFDGWDKPLDDILTKDIEYYPIFEETIRLYEVTFIDGNGDIFEQIQVPYGGNGEIPNSIPTKDETRQYYYEFTLWQTLPYNVRTDMEIHAQFNRFLQEYQVTFIDEHGNILRQQMVEYGTGATEPVDDLIPRKADTREYTYTFSGWSRPFGNVTEDMIVQTVYIGVLRTYVYTFYDDDHTTILKQVRGGYGTQIVEPPHPTKPGNESTTYHFIGWDKVVAETLTDNISYYAVYDEQPTTYRVLFFDGTGDVISSQRVNYQTSATEPFDPPTKPSSAMYDYIFDGWDQSFDSVESDMHIHPTFTAQLRTFEVSFVNYNGDTTVIEVEYGKSAHGRVVTPTRVGYRFVSWDQDISRITSDVRVHATFTPNHYHINFKDDYFNDDFLEPIIAAFDEQVQIPSNHFNRRGYDFTGWKLSPDDESPTYTDQDTLTLNQEGLDLYTHWTPIIYNINYELNGGDAVNPTIYTIEDRIILQNAQKEDHRFVGWFMEKEEEENGIQMMSTMNEPQEKELIPVDVIEEGMIGDITLIAIFEYDGYIQLRDESTLGLYHADITTTIPIYEREAYDDDNPVYLLGVFLGQTLGNLRENFINDNLVFTDKDGNILDDEQVVATGYQIIITDEEDETMIKDRVNIVLKGDADGDGRITVADINAIDNMISGRLEILEVAKLLSVDLDNDGRITVADANILDNHISGRSPIHDSNKNSTIGGS